MIVSRAEILWSYLLKKRGMRTLDRVAGVEPKLVGPTCWRGTEMWGFMILDPVFREGNQSRSIHNAVQLLYVYPMQVGARLCHLDHVLDISVIYLFLDFYVLDPNGHSTLYKILCSTGMWSLDRSQLMSLLNRCHSRWKRLPLQIIHSGGGWTISCIVILLCTS